MKLNRNYDSASFSECFSQFTIYLMISYNDRVSRGIESEKECNFLYEEITLDDTSHFALCIHDFQSLWNFSKRESWWFDFEHASRNRLITFDSQNSTYRERLSISHKTFSRTKKRNRRQQCIIFNIWHISGRESFYLFIRT